MSRPAFDSALSEWLRQREAAGLQRRLRSAADAPAGRIVLDRRLLVDFGSNDYLGLARHPRLIEALTQAAPLGLGARASHLLGGHHEAHAALEAELADWLGAPRVLLFSTGYMAATGALSALLGRHDLCLQDRLNHACLIDGARLAGANLQRYAHAEMDAAEQLLRGQPQRRALLVSDSVFSMDGDLAPLPALAALARRHGAWLMVDEAHGLGVLGPQGRGACAAAGLSHADVPVWMGTFGKALGGVGACIAGSDLLIDTLINRARSFVYTTAMPPALAQALLHAVRMARAADAERQQLADRIEQLRSGTEALGLPLLPSTTPIQPLIVGDNARALAWSQQLEAAGYYCPAVRAPTVPAGTARLRISLSAAHSSADIDGLLGALAGLAQAAHR